MQQDCKSELRHERKSDFEYSFSGQTYLEDNANSLHGHFHSHFLHDCPIDGRIIEFQKVEVQDRIFWGQ